MTQTAVHEPEIQVVLSPDERRAALAEDVRRGLTARPKRLPPKWHYDVRGSRLFDAITQLPEYYLTRAERLLLERHADEIATDAAADTLVELGAGTSAKTRLLLDALDRAGQLRSIVVFDVDEGTLRLSAQRLATEYPNAEVRALVGDLERHLGALPRNGRRLVAFLGSSIGNFTPHERARLLGDLRRALAPGDAFLLGVDLVKPRERLEGAYDDAAGVTALFSLNVLAVVNRELDADFELAAFEHVSFWDEANEWIDIRLRSARAQRVRVGALDLVVEFAEGEELHTEISAKFRRAGIARELAAAGFQPSALWANDVALALARVV